MVVSEQPSSQEPHRGLPTPSIVRGPPARLRLRRRPERAEPGAAPGPAGREKRPEQGAHGGHSRRRYRGRGSLGGAPGQGVVGLGHPRPGKAALRGGCSGTEGAGGSPRGARVWLTLSSSSLSPGAGGRPSGAGQPVPEEGPECPGPEEPCGRGGRRLRTAFSAEQISTLESSFQRQQYLGAAERRQLAGRMRLSEVQIKTWFQNRRMKLKRQLQELRTEPFCSPALPYGPQGAVVPLPLTYVARPPALPRQGAASEGFPLAALPAPALDLSSACRAQPVGFWAAPCYVGYRDPRAFLLGV
ncbi:LOW QUALITY PROTEIN: homeobox protein vent1B-like [Vidua chalybeata]|uniref:LOW QUALITY PROTEIN: homeobox protein vent1B-like n=1 Tax=Vidua chalybeata TaxID=81927 RepID=UPI0023A7F35A|nr:LOW QUALITY PROTEIN: homeobox protein vent1B-like [Vidua chalybeata]